MQTQGENSLQNRRYFFAFFGRTKQEAGVERKTHATRERVVVWHVGMLVAQTDLCTLCLRLLRMCEHRLCLRLLRRYPGPKIKQKQNKTGQANKQANKQNLEKRLWAFALHSFSFRFVSTL